MILKSVITTVVLLSSLQAGAFREVRNGGGGTKVDGRYLTFHSARIAIDTPPENADQIPGLKTLIAAIQSLPLDSAVKGKFLSPIFASSGRRYFRVDDSQIFDAERKQIIGEYSRLMNIPESEVVLFAVTSPEAKGTLLLPEFYSLTETEQAAILLHESLWIWNPNAKYKTIVAIEQSLQAYLEEPQNPARFYDLILQFARLQATPAQALAAALTYDMQNQTLSAEFSQTQRILAKDLLGEAFLTTGLRQESFRIHFSFWRDQTLGLLSELPQLRAERPQSLFYQALFDYIPEDGSYITITDFVPPHRRQNGAEALNVSKVRSLSDEEFSAYLGRLYIDVSQKVSGEPLQLNLVLEDGTTVGGIVFH